MIQCQLKLRLTKTQERTLGSWLPILGSVWNWACRKIELNACDGIYFSKVEFNNLLVAHGERLGIPSHVLQGILANAHLAWQRCFKKLGRKPRLKGVRNKLNGIPFPDPFKRNIGNRISLPGIRNASVRFHKQSIPEGKIKCGRIVKRASGWYLCLFIDAEPKAIPALAHGTVGIDPGFSSLLTLSNGEKIDHPRELEASAKRLAQAQRGHRKHLAASIQEHAKNQRKDRNHKLSRRLIAENALIVFSADNHTGVSSKFGKSVSSSAHSQLRQMLAYKSRAGGRLYVEVDSRNSTRMCSTCKALTGPSGLAQLSVRRWVCSACGSPHDRDINAAINTLNAGVGSTHERAA